MATTGILDTAPYTAGPKVRMPVAYTARDLIIYALGIGITDPRYIYELHPDFAAFPTYPIVLTFKGDSFDALPFPSPIMDAYPTPPLDAKVLLDAEKLIEKVAEIPKDGAQLELVGGVIGVHAKGKGALCEREFEVVDGTGKVYYRIVDATFLVGVKPFTESGNTFSKSAPPPSGVPMHVAEASTDPNIASLHRLSGDYNPLHVDSQFATKAGFEKPIMHGQCTMGFVARSLLDALVGGDQRRFRSIQLRFSSPVSPGQTLVTEIWRESPIEYVFQTKVKETGKVCISNGRFQLTPEGKL
mmetsp:Transcript_81899/g.227039  ORF Transcript_81899/g.227039 Transcript_81899/m.227039 type:complete len:300 (-) Transcript_81899:41-940(-)